MHRTSWSALQRKQRWCCCPCWSLQTAGCVSPQLAVAVVRVCAYFSRTGEFLQSPCFARIAVLHAQTVLYCVPFLALQTVPSAAGPGEGPSSSSGQDAVDTAAVQLAAQVLHAIVVQHRSLVRAALQNMPPLPSLAVLKEVNAVLIQVCGILLLSCLWLLSSACGGARMCSLAPQPSVSTRVEGQQYCVVSLLSC
jgi:hypothetical protein